MEKKTISATDAARQFSDVLNQVRYQGTEFDIVRGREVVARLVPAADKLDELMHQLPHLGVREAKLFARDIERGLARMRPDVIEWD